MVSASKAPTTPCGSIHAQFHLVVALRSSRREIPLPTAELPHNLDRALALEIAHDIGHRVLRRNADAHMNVIPHHVPFHDLRFPL